MKNIKKKFQNSRFGKPENIITTLIFAVLLFAMTFGSLVLPDKEFSETENRKLQTNPQFSFSRLLSGKYTAEFEEYVQDQFMFRDRWIFAKNICELALGKNEINGIFVCADGYYIEDHKKSLYTTELALKNSAAAAEFCKKYYEILGEEHISVILAPTAQTVLRDKLPPLADPYDQNEFIYAFAERLPDGVFVDAGKALAQHSDEEIYYRTDHHWTSYGAYLAYEQWAKSKGFEINPQEYYTRETLAEDFLGTINSKLNLPMQADKITAYLKPNAAYTTLNSDGEAGDSLIDESYLSGKDKYGAFLGGNEALLQINTENKNGKRLVIFKDSYANCFVPMIADEFETVYVVDLRYYNYSVSELIESVEATDIMLLYNADSAATDTNLRKIMG